MKKEVWIKLVKRIGNWIVNICFYSCVAFVALDGIAGVLPDFFQNPLQFNGTGIAFGRQNTGG